MTGNFVKIGNWQGIEATIKTLPYYCNRAAILSLRQWAAHAENEAIFRVRGNMGFNWQPLAQSTIDRKFRAGYPLNTYVETSSYVNNIYSIIHNAQLTAFAGVSRNRSARSGEYGEVSVEESAELNEFGFMEANLPARPLWQPVGDRALTWLVESKNRPSDILILLLNKKLAKSTIILPE